MKITKKHLKRVIQEEKLRLLREQSEISKQVTLLSAIDQGIGKVEEVEKELYGLIDPDEAGLSISRGDYYGEQLAAAVEMLNQAYAALEIYFESEDIVEGRPWAGGRKGATLVWNADDSAEEEEELNESVLVESLQSAEERLFNALDEYASVLVDEGLSDPGGLKAEVLNFVDGYFEDTEYAASQAEHEEGLAAQGFKNPSYG